MEFYFHQLSKCRGLMSTLTLHPSGVHFHRLPETSVFCSGGSSHLLLLGPTAKSLPCSNGKKSCRTSLQLSLKQKSAYGDGLVWVFREMLFITFRIGLNIKEGMSPTRASSREPLRIAEGWEVNQIWARWRDHTTITLKDHPMHSFTRVPWRMLLKTLCLWKRYQTY